MTGSLEETVESRVIRCWVYAPPRVHDIQSVCDIGIGSVSRAQALETSAKAQKSGAVGHPCPPKTLNMNNQNLEGKVQVREMQQLGLKSASSVPGGHSEGPSASLF